MRHSCPFFCLLTFWYTIILKLLGSFSIFLSYVIAFLVLANIDDCILCWRNCIEAWTGYYWNWGKTAILNAILYCWIVKLSISLWISVLCSHRIMSSSFSHSYLSCEFFALHFLPKTWLTRLMRWMLMQSQAFP